MLLIMYIDTIASIHPANLKKSMNLKVYRIELKKINSGCALMFMSLQQLKRASQQR